MERKYSLVTSSPEGRRENTNLMLLLVPALVLSVCLVPPAVGEVSINRPALRYTTVKPSLLSQAMAGVDPLAFGPLGQPNSGLKDMIFAPGVSVPESCEMFQLNNFMGKTIEDIHCYPLPLPSMRSLYNYNTYRKAMGESVSFATPGDDATVGGQVGVGATSCNQFAPNTNEEEELVEFFRRGGEVIMGEVQCQTHVVSVNLNSKPTFTEHFYNALKKISSVARDLSSEKSRNTFLDFVKDFGTHFQDTTYFGSRLLITQLFARKADNFSEKIERHRCVSSSFSENLHKNFEDTAQRFISDASQCEHSGPSQDVVNSMQLSPTQILTIGTVSFFDQDEPNPRVVPIHYRLERISRIFQEDWFDTIGYPVDGAVMKQYFDNMTSEYQKASFGAPCAPATKTGCGYNSNCNLDERCFDDKSTNTGFFCKKLCDISGICPEKTVCVHDESLDGFSCMKGCRYTVNCSENTVCVDDDSSDGFSCMKGCQYTSNCAENTACMNDDSVKGFSCKKGCTYTDNCTFPMVCVDEQSETGYTCQDPCSVPETCASDEACYVDQNHPRGYICVSTKPGRAVIVGGKSGRDSYQSVEHVNFRPIPDLPVRVSRAAMATAGDYLILCGGKQEGKQSDKCHRFNINGTEWETMASLPMPVYGHSAVSIGNSRIWFIHMNSLFEFDGETSHFSTTILPFHAFYYHCSVSNGTYAYVIGTGTQGKEIWVNERPMDPSKWRKVETMLQNTRKGQGCIWYDTDIMITGGDHTPVTVEIFNTEVEKTRLGKQLLTYRTFHHMMMLDGMPTVLGGEEVEDRNTYELNTFESFSFTSDEWLKVDRTLSIYTSFFAFTEF